MKQAEIENREEGGVSADLYMETLEDKHCPECGARIVLVELVSPTLYIRAETCNICGYELVLERVEQNV